MGSFGLGGSTGGGGGNSTTSVIPITSFVSTVESATLANGTAVIALSPTVEQSIQWSCYAAAAGTLTPKVDYEMSAANSGGVRLRFDTLAVSSGADGTAALTTGTAATVTPGNDALRHVATGPAITVAAGDRVVVKLTRIAADGADTHTGDMRIAAVAMT